MSSVNFTNEPRPSDSNRGIVAASALLVVAVLVWLWPIGLGGEMPVGGDVTQFSLGLMAFSQASLRQGRLPLWNDLWGYGFPGVGESQMGVFYPPHWLLYGLLPLEMAYTASLALHTIWGGLGASWAARRFGVSPLGSALSGFAFAASGFFFVHLSHQWGATTGCWTPWAWGLAWTLFQHEKPGRSAAWLAVVLTFQMLPGHYQLAFVTQVGVIVLAVVRSLSRSRRVSRSVLALLSIGYAFALGAVQLWPTLRLARLAATRRDFEYLSGFAVSPIHLVTFLAPGLFERSPLWRPIVWDPFHTSPEEYLGYVGLAPLFLAVLAIVRKWSTPEVVALLTVGLASLILSFGPYAVGFRTWSTWPGFSFFRAPARWMIGVSLALSILAGIGFDGLASWPRVGRALRRFLVLGAAIVLGVVGVIEAGLFVGASPDRPLAPLFGKLMDALPWGEPRVFVNLIHDAQRPQNDHRVEEAWARQGKDLTKEPSATFITRRWEIYGEELAPTALLFVALAVASGFSRTPRALQSALLVLTILDLCELSRQRRVDLGPITPLVDQSPVLKRLSESPRGTRTIDTIRNLPMVAGAAPVSAYRTLDLPALETLNLIVSGVPANPGELSPRNRARALTGASIRIYEPSELAALSRVGLLETPGTRRGQVIEDPVLASWRLGEDWVRQNDRRASRFRVDEVEGGGVLAWRIPLTEERFSAILEPWSGDPATVLEAMAGAEPVRVDSPDPERRSISLVGEGPGLLVISNLADPQWRAEWSSPSESRPAEILRAFGRPGQGAWQAVRIPPGKGWTLRLRYEADDVWMGMRISAVAWAGLALFTAGSLLRNRRMLKERT